ncbi:MAG: HNH endonuclease, partial [Proteobacteria bacterium]|nr:HNH endonuclease [Pseudomonadota bacterium]
MITDDQGEPLSIGRRQRTIPRKIRQALLARDKRCTFPGCTHEYWLGAHHVKHWATGGENSLDNLVLL